MLLNGEYIEMQGNIARLMERRLVREVRLEDVANSLEVSKPVTLPTIARAQVFAHVDESDQTSKKLYVLSEIPAGIKNISKNLGDRGARRYRLAMPWTYIWFACSTTDNIIRGASWAITDYKIFHAQSRYDGINDPMIVARVPNVYEDGRICWGATGVSPNMSLANRIDQLTNEWYLSRFNTDLDGSVPLPYDEGNYRRWVQETRDNPNCWVSWPEWTNPTVTKYTVAGLLANAGQTPRMQEIILADSIPEIPIRLTFGSWEEWWRRLPAEERRRSIISMENMRFDDPSIIPDAPDLVTGHYDDDEDYDDGGVEIPYEDE